MFGDQQQIFLVQSNNPMNYLIWEHSKLYYYLGTKLYKFILYIQDGVKTLIIHNLGFTIIFPSSDKEQYNNY